MAVILAGVGTIFVQAFEPRNTVSWKIPTLGLLMTILSFVTMRTFRAMRRQVQETLSDSHLGLVVNGAAVPQWIITTLVHLFFADGWLYVLRSSYPDLSSTWITLMLFLTLLTIIWIGFARSDEIIERRTALERKMRQHIERTTKK